MKESISTMEREMLGYLFRYEDGLLFKKSVRNNNKWTCCNDLTPGVHGYIPVGVDGKLLKLHRLVYLFHNPDWDIRDSCRDNSIDHISGNPRDNRIENLRVVTNSQNKQNATHYGGHKIKGIGVANDGRARPYKAHWNENGKQNNKYFKTEAEALEHRAKMVELHYTHRPSQRNQVNPN